MISMEHLVDIHCHLLYGVDDGAKDVNEAIQLLKLEKEQHVDRVILTPHYREGIFETPQTIMDEHYAKLCLFEKEMNLGIRLFLGCEYHTNTRMVADLQEKRRPSMAGSQYVLVEFSAEDSFKKIRCQIYNLIMEGWIPIIAHIERYPDMMKDLNNVFECKSLGALIQITSGALLGKMGWKMQRNCKKLIKQDLVDFVASDAHDTKNRRPDLGECATYLEKKYGQDYTYKLLVENPEMLLGGHKNYAVDLSVIWQNVV